MLLLTLIPFGGLDEVNNLGFEYWDKIIHFFLFGTHAFLLSGLMKGYKKDHELSTGLFPVIFMLSFLFGFLIEITQWFIPARSFDFFDLIANSIGILTGMFVFYIKFNFFTN